MCLSISFALIVEILCEMFMGSQKGIGQRITESYANYTIEQLYAAILIAGFFGFLLNRLFVVLERRVVPWVNK